MLPYPENSTIPSGPSAEPDRQAHHAGYGKKFTRKDVTSDEDPFAYLRHFDTAFLIDDSESMRPYWGEVRELLNAIADLCVTYDKNGIDVYFVNHRPRGSFFTGKYGYKNIGNTNGEVEFHDNIAGIFHNVEPKGKCRLGEVLGRIFDDYLHELYAVLRYTESKYLKPLNLIVITAGHCDDNPFRYLLGCAKRLDELDAPPYQLGVQLFQIGQDEGVRQKWEYADEDLTETRGFRDIVDTVTWTGNPGELSAEAVLKVVLGSVCKSLDKTEV